jgi:hypothetical protein
MEHKRTLTPSPSRRTSERRPKAIGGREHPCSWIMVMGSRPRSPTTQSSVSLFHVVINTASQSARITLLDDGLSYTCNIASSVPSPQSYLTHNIA